MPFLGAQRWLLPRAPTLLALLLVLLMSVSLALQSVALRRLLLSPAASSSVAPESRSHSTDMQSLLPLFGSDAATTSVAPNTTLRLTLLGSFVRADNQRSSAIIQLEGNPAKRYAVGQELSNGVSLYGVYRDRVELKRNGRVETLSFSKSQPSPSAAPATPAPDGDTLTQLQALGEENTQQLQQNMQALRERLQAAEAAPAMPPDSSQNTESPEPSTEAY